MRDLARRLQRLEAAKAQRAGRAFVIELCGDSTEASSLRGKVTREAGEDAAVFERRAIATLMPEQGTALITFA